jgi:hypothetical protein
MNAEQVVIWLGVGTPNRGLGFKYLKKVWEAMRWDRHSGPLTKLLLKRIVRQIKERAPGACEVVCAHLQIRTVNNL